MINIVFRVLTHPLYFLLIGSRQKVIDFENERLARSGASKVCIDFKSGSYSNKYTYIDGNPATTKKQYKSIRDFIEIDKKPQ